METAKKSWCKRGMFTKRRSVNSLLGALPVLVSCTSQDAGTQPPRADSGDSGLPSILFEMSTTIDPGAESQQCKLVQMPTDRGVIAVPSAESHFTPGSHHFLVYRTKLTQMPDGGGGVVDCMEPSGNAASVIGSYYEAQQPDMKRDLPARVAHLFQPGEVMALQTHYVNATNATIDAKVTFKLHTMDPTEVEHEAGSILFSNFGLVVPPNARVTQTRACPVPAAQDMNLLLLWSHMHRRGVHFVATTDDGDVQGPLYETSDWSEPQARVFGNDPPTTIHAGSHIVFSCDYDNSTSQKFTYGPSALTNEMCILHGMYWPRADPATEFCLAGSNPLLSFDAGLGDAATKDDGG